MTTIRLARVYDARRYRAELEDPVAAFAELHALAQPGPVLEQVLEER